jgi:uncharacterized protein
VNSFRLVGVLHLPPLPGASNYGGERVCDLAEAAAADAHVLQSAGFCDVMIQDASDKPQPVTIGPPTVAALAVIGAAVRSATDIGLGVIAGHNDGPASVAIAHAVEADFIRVKVHTGTSMGPTGLIEGCCVAVAQMKRLLGSQVQVWADVHEATSTPLVGDRCGAAVEALTFGAADKLIVTRDSGVSDALEDIGRIRDVVPDDTDVLIGGRVTSASLAEAMRGADGAILGSALKDPRGGSSRVDPTAAQSFGAHYRAYLSS